MPKLRPGKHRHYNKENPYNKHILKKHNSTPDTVERIIREVCKVYNVSVRDVRGQKRKQEISEARQMSMYIVKEVCGLTMKDIGSEFDGRDHSSVVYTINKVNERIKKDSFYRDTVEDIIKNIKTM